MIFEQKYHRLNLFVATSFINQTDNLILFSIYERLGRIRTKHRLRIRDIQSISVIGMTGTSLQS